jgi:hypothetical protein
MRCTYVCRYVLNVGQRLQLGELGCGGGMQKRAFLSRREAQRAGARLWTGPSFNTGCRMDVSKSTNQRRGSGKTRERKEVCVEQEQEQRLVWCESSCPLSPPGHLWLSCHFFFSWALRLHCCLREETTRRELRGSVELRRADADGWQNAMLFASLRSRGRTNQSINQSDNQSRQPKKKKKKRDQIRQATLAPVAAWPSLSSRGFLI